MLEHAVSMVINFRGNKVICEKPSAWKLYRVCAFHFGKNSSSVKKKRKRQVSNFGKKNGSPYLRRSGWCKGKQSRKPNLMAELIGFRLQKDHRANFLIGIKYLTAICLYVCPTRDFLLPLAVASLVFHEILLPLKSLFSGEIKIFGIHFLGSLSPNNYLSNANILTFLILPFVFF